ncbi:DUF6340 family protein [Bacteroidota bacterium]
MRISFKGSILMGMCILLSSCTTYIFYPIEYPPQIKTESESNRIAFINRYDYTSLTFTNNNKTAVFADGTRQLIRKLESSFKADENFEFIMLDSLEKGRALKGFPVILSANRVVSICKKNNTDLLLLLESFNADFDIESETVRDEDGSRSTTNYVDLIVEAGFSLFKSNGELLDRLMATERSHYQSRPALSRFIVIGPSMGNAGKEVNELAGGIGENYIYSFYPSQDVKMKMIYAGKHFSEVTPLMKSQRWEEAIKLLMPLANSPDPKIAKKAAHNLAIVYDALGDFEAYEYWINK